MRVDGVFDVLTFILTGAGIVLAYDLFNHMNEMSQTEIMISMYIIGVAVGMWSFIIAYIKPKKANKTKPNLK